jgi:hypothetical protein
VYQLLWAEEQNIQTLIAEYNSESFHLTMLNATRDLFDLVLPNDACIADSYQHEYAEITKYRKLCQQHLALIYKVLFSADYAVPIDQLKTHVKTVLLSQPKDSHLISTTLNQRLGDRL